MPPATLWSRWKKRNLAPFSELSAVDPSSSDVLGLAREGLVACAAKDTVASSTAGVVPTLARQSPMLANSQLMLLQLLLQQLLLLQLLLQQLLKPPLVKPLLLKPLLLKRQLQQKPLLLLKQQLLLKRQLLLKPQLLQKPPLLLKPQLLLSKILYGYLSE